jgi:hypothetical protein
MDLVGITIIIIMEATGILLSSLLLLLLLGKLKLPGLVLS